MSNRRRIIIITISVMIGSAMSAGIYVMKKGTLSGDDYFSLITNIVFSLLLILGIGYVFVWRKK
ncbi:MAG: hypothetical protein HKN22_00950 [Bacteroidia bacterium]|nr:hypothetical protein [Bacteroidia bacterium]